MTTIDSQLMTADIRAERRFPARRKIARLIVAAVATLAIALLAPGLTPTRVQADTGNSPMVVAQTMVNSALQVLANKSTTVQQRRRQLRQVVENEFDFTEMSRSALGYHWRSLTPDQRAQFTELFTAFIEDAYLSKIQDYSGERVQFDGQTPLGQGYMQINTDIIQPGKNPITVNYLLLQKNDTWKIYDVTVDAISIIANYRNQFNRVINDRGFDQLMADLRAKQQELASLLGG